MTFLSHLEGKACVSRLTGLLAASGAPKPTAYRGPVPLQSHLLFIKIIGSLPKPGETPAATTQKIKGQRRGGGGGNQMLGVSVPELP